MVNPRSSRELAHGDDGGPKRDRHAEQHSLCAETIEQPAAGQAKQGAEEGGPQVEKAITLAIETKGKILEILSPSLRARDAAE